MSQLPAIAVDACVAINIYATGRWEEIFSACGLRPVMSLQAARESMWVLEDEGERQPVDLEALVKAGHLEVHAPVDEEIEVLIELAARLGDGEAACLAIAESRGMLLATDDRAARREAQERDLADRLRSTADLLRIWSERGSASNDEVHDAVRRVQEGARYFPPASDPNAAWWSERA